MAAMFPCASWETKRDPGEIGQAVHISGVYRPITNDLVVLTGDRGKGLLEVSFARVRRTVVYSV